MLSSHLSSTLLSLLSHILLNSGMTEIEERITTKSTYFSIMINCENSNNFLENIYLCVKRQQKRRQGCKSKYEPMLNTKCGSWKKNGRMTQS